MGILRCRCGKPKLPFCVKRGDTVGVAWLCPTSDEAQARPTPPPPEGTFTPVLVKKNDVVQFARPAKKEVT